jgi:uncharacterized membrane protein
MPVMSKVSLRRQLAGHLTMGGALGASLAISLLLCNAQNVFQMIVNSTAPNLMIVVFVSTFTLIFAIGATLTGLIFILEERDK